MIVIGSLHENNTIELEGIWEFTIKITKSLPYWKNCVFVKFENKLECFTHNSFFFPFHWVIFIEYRGRKLKKYTPYNLRQICD